MGVNFRVLDQKQQKISGRISLCWSVELQGRPEQLNGGDHDWLIQTLVSTVQRGSLKATVSRRHGPQQTGPSSATSGIPIQ